MTTNRRGLYLLVLAVCTLSVLILFTYATIPHDQQVSSQPSAFSLTLKNGAYSLSAREAPLVDILKNLEELSGVTLRVDSGLRASVTADIEEASLEKLLEQLSESHAMVYEQTDEGIRLVSAAVTSQQEKMAVRKSGPSASLAPRPSHILSNSPRTPDELLRREHVVLLANATIDTDVVRKRGVDLEIPERFKAEEDCDGYIVQFDHTVSDKERALLTSMGITVCHYVPNASFAVRTSPTVAEQLRALTGVIYVGAYHPYYKIGEPILKTLLEDAEEADKTLSEEASFNVMFFRGVNNTKSLKKQGVKIVSERMAGDRRIATVRCTADKITELARNNDIQWIEPYLQPELMNDHGRRKLRGPNARIQHPELDGSGVIVGIMDSGIDFNHRTFAIDQSLHTSTGTNTRIVYYEARAGLTSDGIPGDTNGHGTHVAASVLGNGALSDTVLSAPGSGPAPYSTNQFAGVAPNARVVMIEDFNSFTDEEASQIQYNQGARIGVNSWGDTFFLYGTLSATWDALVRDADNGTAGEQEMTVFFSNGNSGGGDDEGVGGSPRTVGQPANAKNVISVGAAEQARIASNLVIYGSVDYTDSDWQVAPFSSRGPVGTSDKRIKPDIMAPGVYVISAQSKDTNPDALTTPGVVEWDYRFGNVDSGTNYAFFSGTSMACPLAGGAAALIYQHYTNTQGKAPSPAMMKAIMVAGARPLNTTLYGSPARMAPDSLSYFEPSIIYDGWGMVDVVHSIDGPGLQPSDDVVWLDQDDTTPVATNGVYQRLVSVGVDEGGLRVVLAWTDEPGTPGNAVQLVNDLDLVVWEPGGAQGYAGNFFNMDGLASIPLSQPTNSFYGDRYNNVEVIDIPETFPGTYTIQVRGYQVPVGPQDFSIAIIKGGNYVGSHSMGDHPDMVLDADQSPVVAFSSLDSFFSSKQIYVKRWLGTSGDASEVGRWKRLEDKWFDIAGSARNSGISQTLEISEDPVVAVFGDDVHVAWVEQPQGAGVSKIYYRGWNGANWAELGGSASGSGLSGSQSYDSTDPSIGMTTDGFPVVCWRQPVLQGFTYSEQVRVARWNGTNWVGYAGSNTNGIPGTGQVSANPQMVMNLAGNPIVAWEDTLTKTIMVSQWSGGSWVSIGTLGSGVFATEPDLAVAPNGDIYAAWRHWPSGATEANYQIYAQQYSGGSWSEFGGSATYPGISRISNINYTVVGPSIDVAPNGDVLVTWQQGVSQPNSIFVKRWDGFTWEFEKDTFEIPGIHTAGGVASNATLRMDNGGQPVVCYESYVSGASETFVYRVVADELPPAFNGLSSAVGGTNGDVTLSWSAAIDTSTQIVYHIYQSTTNWPCDETPMCDAVDVFTNEIATVTNLTTYMVTNLVSDQFWCWGVRAEDTNGLLDVNEVMRAAGPVSGVGDPDNDCLDSSFEFLAGTEPCQRDTDGDGMWDGWEWTYSANNPSNASAFLLDPLDNGILDPLQGPYSDLDGDGALNIEEFQWWYTNSFLANTNLCDAESPYVRYSPDPAAFDSDGDGIPDGWEMQYGLDPLDPSDAGLDGDGDSFTNLAEYLLGTDPTDPRSPLQVDDDGPNDPEASSSEISDPLEDGSLNHPYDAIQEAIDAAPASEVIYVYDGTYSGEGNRDIGLLGKQVHIRSANGRDTTFIETHTYHAGFIIEEEESTNSIIQGFTIRSWKDYGGIEAIRCDGSSPKIINCRIYESADAGVKCLNDASPIITNCIIEDIAGDGISLDGGAAMIQDCLVTNCDDYGISAGGGSLSRIEQCEITGNKDGGIYLNSGSDARLIALNIHDNGETGITIDNSSPYMVNCLITKNASGGTGGGINIGANSYPTGYNCTVSANNADDFGGVYWDGEPTFRNFIIWGNTANNGFNINTNKAADIQYSILENFFPGLSNQVVDPLLTDGYYVLPGSPALDSGIPEGAPTNDFDGTARPLDGDGNGVARIDIGAFEQAGTAAPGFNGLTNAVGGTNSNVNLYWPATSNVTGDIYFHIYQGTTVWFCGTIPTCSVSDVFANEIAVVTNALTYEVTGLAAGSVWCFGVRAEGTNGVIDINTRTRNAGPAATGPGDADGDCLDNPLETASGLDSCLQDTDGDTMWDGWEWTYSFDNPSHINALAMDPLDDGSGDELQDANKDLDGDGATNYEEFEWWYNNSYLANTNQCDSGSPNSRYSPDPTDYDTDDDGMADGYEIEYGLNPLDDTDAAIDQDGDSFTNLEEFQMGSDPADPLSPFQVDDNGPNDPRANDPEISDPDEDGSLEHPFDAIQEAVDISGPDDVILVRDGTYSGVGNRDISLGQGGTRVLEEDYGTGGSNLTLNVGVSSNDLLSALLGTNDLPTGVTDLTLSYEGPADAQALYSSFPDIQFSAQPGDGILLSSGKAEDAQGPNTAENTTTDLGVSGDDDMDKLVNADSYDAVSVVLNFSTDESVVGLSFHVLFGSEEFPEYVGSFNDAFAAFLDDVNISFDQNGLPITVNNNFFQLDNDPWHPDDSDAEGKNEVVVNVEYDGLTPLLITEKALQPGRHRLVLMVADAGDEILDSAAFLSNLKFETKGAKGLKLLSENGPDHTFVDTHTYHAGFIVGSAATSNNLLQGFSIRSWFENGGVQGIIVNGGNITIRDCRIWDCGLAGIECNDGASPIIDNCVIEGNMGDGISFDDGTPTVKNSVIASNVQVGILCDAGCSPIIQDTEIHHNLSAGISMNNNGQGVLARLTIQNNEDSGIQMDDSCSPRMENLLVTGNVNSDKGGGIFVGENCAPTGFNCTVMNNTAEDVGGIYWEEGEPIFRNMIIYDNSADNDLDISTNFSADIQYSILGNFYPGLSNQVVDPQLTADWRPTAGSPAVEAGTSANAPSNDLDRLLRPLDGDQDGFAWHDIGAYEYNFQWILSFNGIQSAVGGTNQNITVSWQTVSNVPGDITYHVYQSAQSWTCGDEPSCNAGNVFANEIAVVTNTASYELTNLVEDVLWCFGVRARSALAIPESNTVMLTAAASSGIGDTDDDCLDNGLEQAANTEPCIRDTDGDGMWDGWEWTYSTNNPSHAEALALSPLDNGTKNVRTGAAGDPSQSPLADLDGDGLSNQEEFDWWYEFSYVAGGNTCDAGSPTNRNGPNPTVADTDGDGIADGWEIFNDLDPLDPSDGALDPDGDGVVNSNEYAYGTSPMNEDSDSDGLTDGYELTNAAYGVINPSLADTDLDGLDDGDEIRLGADPTDADSNDSGVSDGDTYQLGWDDPSVTVTNFRFFLRETFEWDSTTRSNWTHHAPNAAFPFERWHMSTAEPAPKTNNIVYLHERSTNTSYRFADDVTASDTGATYNLGIPLEGALESPLIDVSAAQTLTLAWNEYRDTQPNADLLLVKVRSAANTNWNIVAGPMSGNSEGWTHHEIDISTYAGAGDLQIRFLFTANGLNNDYHGWYVDDVSIYEGVSISGWVRDNNGRAIPGASVYALGRGGLTNAIAGHRFLMPGKTMGQAMTAADGSYEIRGLPQGIYYVKAAENQHKTEFFNGPLTAGGYSFGNGLNPGVFARDDITAGGTLDMLAIASAETCEFELEKGKGRAYLGVKLSNTNGLKYQVYADSIPMRVWSGVADTNLTDVTGYNDYQTKDIFSDLLHKWPDWDTNPTQPRMLGDLAPGKHQVYAGTDLTFYPAPSVTLSEAELVVIDIQTNQSEGRLYVAAEDGEAYTIWVDGRQTTNQTPAVIPVKAGAHQVMLISADDDIWITSKQVSVPIGGRTTVTFTTNNVAGNSGALLVKATDSFGSPIIGASVYVDGRLVNTNQAKGGTNTTPAVVPSMKPGTHSVNVVKDGYRLSESRVVTIYNAVTSAVTFALYQADRDYDLVGDATEIESYSNLFLYSRSDDPDGDTLSNLAEFELFRLFGQNMNIFNADTDGDGMLDGQEIGYNGDTNTYAVSEIVTNLNVGADTVRALFVGQYLSGVNNFGSGYAVGAVDCDRFEASAVTPNAPVVPTEDPAIALFSGIPPTVTDRAIGAVHLSGETVLADTIPTQTDSDGDGMWDGFEYLYGMSTIAMLDPIACGRMDSDPDTDGLSNMEEFLGRDGVANTNDWTNPTSSDTDGDGMLDGWEYSYGLNPNDPSDALLDPDGDQLPNLSESILGTSPSLADTDGDGVDDGLEVLTYKSNPTDMDTDDDGLLDGREIWDKDLDGVADGGFFPAWQPYSDIDGDGYWDGPTDWDTDGDGMPDGFEVIDAFGNLRNPFLDPSNPNDGDEDADGDGLSNYEEYLVRDGLFGNTPESFGYGTATWDYYTDPFDPDSDGDGMPDGWEVMMGLHPQDPIPVPSGTNFTRFSDLGVDGDLDQDGLYNEREFSVRFAINAGEDLYDFTGASTHPWNPDTDADGLVDGEEDRAFRSNPIVHDSDADGLADGAGATWGEVESALRDAAGNPTVTNHYDLALNDLWQLRWPAGAALPHWEMVVVDGTNFPAPRWGAVATYVPVFEGKDEKGDPSVILLDNRQIVLIGGRDGVTKFTDIWEYQIRSNEWHRSAASLDDIGFTNGLSELAAVPIFGYYNTKDPGCPCQGDTIQYDCDGEEFGEPKNRPWDNGYHRSSFDWTYILGGWDNAYDYYITEPMISYYYKSTDDPRPVTEAVGPNGTAFDMTEVVETLSSTGGVVSIVTNQVIESDLQSAGVATIPLGLYITQESQQTVVTNQQGSNLVVEITTVTRYRTNTASAVHFAESMFPRPPCETLLVASLEFSLVSSPSADVDVNIYGEMAFDGVSPIEYGDEDDQDDPYPPSIRFTGEGWYFNTTPEALTIPAGTPVGTVVTVNLSQIMFELGAQPVWEADTIGLIIDASNATDYVFAHVASIESIFTYRPSYKVEPYWEQGTHVQIPTLQQPDQFPSSRKSMAAVYDFDRDRIVAFGGIDGRRIFGDTFEGTPKWWVNGAVVDGNPEEIGNPYMVVWNKKELEESPSPRWGHSMVYDSVNERVLLFGGFDTNNQPLNDLWAYEEEEWTEITDGFLDNQVPPPRGGACMLVYGGVDYDRGQPGHCAYGENSHIVLFGGTDGESYFNDTWVFYENYANSEIFGSESGRRWVMATPDGENSRAPSPRAFANMIWAQNGRYTPDTMGSGIYRTGSGGSICASPVAYLFGGRRGTLPTSADTDGDLVMDGREYELGGPAGGRDPRLNALVHTNPTEVVPFAFKPIGSVDPTLQRSYIADLEALSYPGAAERGYATVYGLPYQGHPLEFNLPQVYTGGVDAFSAEMTNLWFHRHGGDDPLNTNDEWQLGVPDDSVAGMADRAPRSAYRGRWCYGTDLDGLYENSSIMELYSPLFNLSFPSIGSSSTNTTSYFLLFHEWVDLADSNDFVWVDVVRPSTPADIATRKSGVGREEIEVVAPRNNAANTTGAWRRVVVPLDSVQNETNLYLRFVMQSDSNGRAGGWYIDHIAILQGSEISATLTNTDGNPMTDLQVNLFGVNNLGEPVDTTLTDANGLFQFGLLPYGTYQFGAVSSMFGPVTVDPSSPNASLGDQGVEDLVVADIDFGMPTEVSWRTVPGITYRLEYADTMFGPWNHLTTVVASGAEEIFLDYTVSGLRFYRVYSVSSP